MKVLVLHTVCPAELTAGRVQDEFDLSAAANGIAGVLPGAVIAGVHGEVGEVVDLLGSVKPDVVWNLCEAPLGRPDLEAQLAAVFELLGVRFTGCGSETLALCRRKDLTNAILQASGVPVPRSGVFPCVVKPADEDASSSIEYDCVCEDADALERKRARLSGPLVVQEFLPGREFAVSLWGCSRPEHISIAETVFLNGLQLITYSAKWDCDGVDYANTPLYYNSEILPELRAAIGDCARGAWQAVGARGYLRVDVRLNTAGMPCVLDVNPNPEISPGMGMHRAVTEAGWEWSRFVQAQIEWALQP